MPLLDKLNADLINDAARRRVVIFVGAGASKWAKPTGGGEFLDWTEFLKKTSNELTDEDLKQRVRALVDEREYLFASQLLKDKLEHRWEEVTQAAFGQKAYPSELHKAIIRLRPRIIITTNFDKLIESAWDSENSTDHTYPKVISKIDPNVFRLFRDDYNYIIKIHGNIDDHDSMIFDKATYQTGAFGNTYYKDLISSLLLTHTFLFIGFSMTDPAISSIVEMYAHSFPGMRPHYILQSGNANEIDELWKKHRKLSIIRYKSDQDHLELAEIVNELSIAATSRRKELIAAGLPAT